MGHSEPSLDAALRAALATDQPDGLRPLPHQHHPADVPRALRAT